MPYSRRDHVVPCDRRSRPCSVHRRYAVIDVETTGFDPRSDRIVEIGCAIVDGARVVATWSTLVDPQRPIPPRVTRVHGIADAHVAGAPLFDVAVGQLAGWCERAIPVAHNAAFDRGFLPTLHDRAWLCTVALARRAFPQAPNHRNQTLRRYLGIELAGAHGPLVAHRALDDALVTAQILIRCLEREALGRAIARQHERCLELGLDAA